MLNRAVKGKVNSENKNPNLKIANKLYNLLAITKRKGTLLKRSFFNGLAPYLGLLENLAVAHDSVGKASCGALHV